jgi:hypothetical protein
MPAPTAAAAPAAPPSAASLSSSRTSSTYVTPSTHVTHSPCSAARIHSPGKLLTPAAVALGVGRDYRRNNKYTARTVDRTPLDVEKVGINGCIARTCSCYSACAPRPTAYWTHAFLHLCWGWQHPPDAAGRQMHIRTVSQQAAAAASLPTHLCVILSCALPAACCGDLAVYWASIHLLLLLLSVPLSCIDDCCHATQARGRFLRLTARLC